MDEVSDDAIHPIGVAAERAGITPDVIRAWERRYGVVDPNRDEAGRRVYTSADIARLRLLARATEGGHSIGQVVELPPDQLEELVRTDEAARRAAAPVSEVPESAREVVEAALARVEALDAAGLEALLLRAASLHGVPLLLRGVLAPFFHAVGDQWHEGLFTAAQEHMASAIVRGVLSRLLSGIPVPPGAPALLVATPAGERHEIGALLVAATATLEGWLVTYLGADLPAADIAGAARETRARAVAVSAVYAPRPEALADEISALRAALASDVTLFLGGAATGGLGTSLDGVEALGDLASFQAYLRGMGRR